MHQALIHGILNNDHGSISKALTLIENNLPGQSSLLKELQKYSNQSLRIGVTGPPGAGKSTLTDLLIEMFLKNQKTVGVIAVDPTSPFTGGAFLGDRVRMNNYAWDNSVFIRSMSSNGDLGGLAKRSQELGDVLSASGKDYIIYETVGVGQSEHDIIRAADLCLVVLVPESGDEIQMMKAGLIEIGDIFVINKSDRSGANRLSTALRNLLHFTSSKERVEPSVVNTIGSEKKGLQELHNCLIKYAKKLKKSGELDKRRKGRYKERVLAHVREKLEKKFWTEDKKMLLENSALKIDGTSKAPHVMADDLLSQ